MAHPIVAAIIAARAAAQAAGHDHALVDPRVHGCTAEQACTHALPNACMYDGPGRCACTHDIAEDGLHVVVYA